MVVFEVDSVLEFIMAIIEVVSVFANPECTLSFNILISTDKVATHARS